MPAKIMTSHAGSLPRPDDLADLNLKRSTGELSEEADYQASLAEAVENVVARQRRAGIDIVNDGEYGHSMGHRYDFGAWWTYVFQRLGGLELVEGLWDAPKAPPKPGELALAEWDQRRDWLLFKDAYTDPSSGAASPSPDLEKGIPVCDGPITYIGHDAIARDIAHLKAALEKRGVADGFLNSVAPGSCARFGNTYYKTDEELLYACADAMREEYKAIIDA
ncbi:MAG TPA: hypothetical protein VNT22_07180, partial [Baekduia sp.]|nr:hypothetical protein [Baekduia sp.]